MSCSASVDHVDHGFLQVRCAILEEEDGSYTLLPMTEYFLENIRTSAHKVSAGLLWHAVVPRRLSPVLQLATDEKGCPLTTGAAIVKTDGDRQCPADVDECLRQKIEEQVSTPEWFVLCI